MKNTERERERERERETEGDINKAEHFPEAFQTFTLFQALPNILLNPFQFPSKTATFPILLH